jgi:hypothetical protein
MKGKRPPALTLLQFLLRINRLLFFFLWLFIFLDAGCLFTYFLARIAAEFVRCGSRRILY